MMFRDRPHAHYPEFVSMTPGQLSSLRRTWRRREREVRHIPDRASVTFRDARGVRRPRPRAM